MENSDITFVATAMVSINRDPRLSTHFLMSEGLRFHLWFDDESHPAIVVGTNAALGPGDNGLASVRFLTLAEERSKVAVGLKFTLVGGLDLCFGEGEIQEIREII